jgi:hypothetical protein
MIRALPGNTTQDTAGNDVFVEGYDIEGYDIMLSL